jgi:hypothetical protein
LKGQHDAWIFRLTEGLKKFDGAWAYGSRGMDNRMNFEFKKCGYVLENPGGPPKEGTLDDNKGILLLHYHKCGFRNRSGQKKGKKFLFDDHVEKKNTPVMPKYYVRGRQ